MLPKNENLNDDMIDIMETIQEKYIPKVNEESGLKTVSFGGDQLTEERARNVQMGRSDERTKEERLEGLWPKNEDWHAIRIAYDVDMYYLANPKISNADTSSYSKEIFLGVIIWYTCMYTHHRPSAS